MAAPPHASLVVASAPLSAWALAARLKILSKPVFGKYPVWSCQNKQKRHSRVVHCISWKHNHLQRSMHRSVRLLYGYARGSKRAYLPMCCGSMIEPEAAVLPLVAQPRRCRDFPLSRFEQTRPDSSLVRRKRRQKEDLRGGRPNGAAIAYLRELPGGVELQAPLGTRMAQGRS
jgi:hypothetical protein